MRRIYLIRHGHPDFPLGAHMCLGRTDLPLGPLGRMQACLLGKKLDGVPLTAVYSSPLARCRQTAAALSPEPILIDALAEQDMGPWDGLDFDAIRRDWPALYARRAAEPLLVPPGAETLEQVRKRVVPAFHDLVSTSRGDIALVAHASVIQALMADLLCVAPEESRPLRPPYAGCTILSDDGRFRIEPCEFTSPALTPELAESLLAAADPGENVAAHCRAVAAEAMRIARGLPLPLDRKLLYAASLLHDVARKEKHHAAVAAAWLGELGYPEAAAVIAQHHDWAGGALDEAALLYLADKCIQEDRHVTVAHRFDDSAARCGTAEAIQAHDRRRKQAEALRDEINRLSGKTIVQ